MEHGSADILAICTVDKRQAGGKSPNMERIGFAQTLKQVEEAGIDVVEIVTDAHPQISADISKF